jgi:hypothetical protein
VTADAFHEIGAERGTAAAILSAMPCHRCGRPPENGERRAFAERRRPSSIQACMASVFMFEALRVEYGMLGPFGDHP